MTHSVLAHIHEADPNPTQLSNPEKDRWPTPHSEMVRALVDGKQDSCQQIAYKLNREFGTSYTRSAVIGRIHRMGLSHSPEKKPRTPRIKRAKPLRKPMLRIVAANGNSGFLRIATSITGDIPELACAEVVPLHKTMADLEPNDCRYPYGDGPFTFCSLPKRAGSSYCPEHHALTNVPPTERNLAARRPYR